MQIIPRRNVVYTMSAEHKAAARVRSGETLAFETADCFDGQLLVPGAALADVDWSRINGATGPVYVEGAQPGDTLKVEILDIELADRAVIMEAPGKGVTGLAAEAENTRILPVRDGQLIFSETIALPLQPMIGVIGTAPAGAAIETDTPADHGGNMDCRRITTGAVLYLPVNVPGALLAMGDLHAAMGDGEVCVCGAEISGKVTVRVRVVPGRPLPLPFLVSGERVMALYSAPDLDEAANGAALRMRAFLTEQAHFPADEAGLLLSLAGDLCICQVVDPNKTCRMELPLQLLGSYGFVLP